MKLKPAIKTRSNRPEQSLYQPLAYARIKNRVGPDQQRTPDSHMRRPFHRREMSSNPRTRPERHRQSVHSKHFSISHTAPVFDLSKRQVQSAVQKCIGRDTPDSHTTCGLAPSTCKIVSFAEHIANVRDHIRQSSTPNHMFSSSTLRESEIFSSITVASRHGRNFRTTALLSIQCRSV